jgi:hypothetical protein
VPERDEFIFRIAYPFTSTNFKPLNSSGPFIEVLEQITPLLAGPNTAVSNFLDVSKSFFLDCLDPMTSTTMVPQIAIVDDMIMI